MKKVLMIAYTEYRHDARVRREAETLARTGRYRVSVIVLKPGDKANVSKLAGVRLIEANQKKYTGKRKLRYIGSYLQFMARSFAMCTRLWLKGEVDIIHVHNMPDFLVCAAIAPRLLGRKLILDIHDSMPETYLSKFDGRNSIPFKLLSLEEQLSAALAHRVICVNHIQKDVIVGRGINPDKITLSMNVPDPVLFPNGGHINISEKNNGYFRIVYHGTIAERLGVDLVVQAVAELMPVIPGLQFHLWSKAGVALDEIERLGKSLNVSDKLVIRHGEVPLESLADELKIMNLGVVSNRKGVATDLMLPVKMLEYIALGIPVVAPRLKCIQHYFSEGMLTFFEPGKVDSMGSAILALYQDPGRRIEQARRARAFLDRYGWETHKRDLINMYDTLSKERGH
jgi:glycosyltransferase involved in cell wall biosynthesis